MPDRSVDLVLYRPIYDLRFAGFGPDEARRLGVAAGLGTDAVRHRVFDERLLGIRP